MKLEVKVAKRPRRFVLTRKKLVNGKEIVLSLVELVLLPDLFGRRPAGYIHKVYTDETFRRKGYASRLVKEAVELAKKNDCYKVFLVCDDETILFYESLGFAKHQKGMVIRL